MKTFNFLRLTSADPCIWIKLALRGSVIPTILPRVVICTLFSLLIALIDRRVWNLSISLRDSIVPSIVLGLLLVFRTNTAYERFWEGRKAWGTLINTVRNLSRSIWIAIEEHDPADHQQKIIILRFLVAFAIATKLHLRSEAINSEVADLIPLEDYQKLQTINNPPLEIAFRIGNYLQSQYERNCIHPYQLAAMLKLLDSMVEVLGICERILKTPIPLAYSIHLRQLIFLYCFAAPFQLIDGIGLATPLVVGVIAFTIFGIEEIGEEIENPFGHDANDLPLDQICQTMRINIEELTQLKSTSR